MLKWLLVIVLVVMLTGVLGSRPARWLKLGDLPGDLRWRLGKRQLHFPLTTTLLLSLVAWLLVRLL